MALEWIGLSLAVTRLVLRVTAEDVQRADVIEDVEGLSGKLRAFRNRPDSIKEAVARSLERELTPNLSLLEEQEVRAAAMEVASLLTDLASDSLAVVEAAMHPETFLAYASKHGGNARRQSIGLRAESAFDRILRAACTQFAQLVPSSPTFIPSLLEEILNRVDDVNNRLTRVDVIATDAAHWSHMGAGAAQRAVELLEASERQVVEASVRATQEGLTLGRPIADWSQSDLRVHESIRMEGADGPTPYIAREHDRLLAKALTHLEGPRMIVVIGDSCTGKTRACSEAIRGANLLDWKLIKPLDVDDLVSILHSGIPASTVVWLDEIQNFLTLAGGVAAARAIRRLLTSPKAPPMLFIGTIWPGNLQILSARPKPEDQLSGGVGDIRLLFTDGNAELIQVPNSFGIDELLEAPDDPRLQAALIHAVEGEIVQVLSGGAQLVSRTYGSSGSDEYDAYERAIIVAAAELRRIGHPDPLPEWAVLGAAPGYLDPKMTRWATAPTKWPAQALKRLMRDAREQHSGLRDLHSDGVPAMRPAVEAGFIELHDYLLQHHIRTQRHQPTKQQLWNTLLNPKKIKRLGETAGALAEDAELRGMRQESLQLLRVATASAHLNSRYSQSLVNRLVNSPDPNSVAELEALADQGHDYAQRAFLGLLARRGDPESIAALRLRASAGITSARIILATVLATQSTAESLDELRALADSGSTPAKIRLATTLRDRGGDDAVAELRARGDAGDSYARSSLLAVLATRDEPAAIEELEARAALDESGAKAHLRRSLERRLQRGGKSSAFERVPTLPATTTDSSEGALAVTQDEDLHRSLEAADRGLIEARTVDEDSGDSGLARIEELNLLASAGDESALAELRRRADHVEDSSVERLMEVLGEGWTRGRAARLLLHTATGGPLAEEVLQPIRQHPRYRQLRETLFDSAGSDWSKIRQARHYLAANLRQRGTTEALEELRARARSWDMSARAELLEVLAAQGDGAMFEELRDWADQGSRSAQEKLLEILNDRIGAQAFEELRRCVHATYPTAADILIARYPAQSGAITDLDANALPRYQAI